MASQDQLLDYLKKVTVELHDARARLQESEARRSEPLAIVGMGCRFPGGARSAEQLWELVARRGDAISSAPIDRGWEDTMGVPLDACEGAFVYDATDFDAAFFGISPLEATAMDPQQRLVLEVSWEAIEDAGIDPMSLRRSSAGVYVGTNGQDYIAHTFRGAFGDHGHHFATGTGASVLSGRVSYVLGLEGPALTVDTACSSSLVAIHLACQALRARECDLALAGGSVVMSTPFPFLQSAVYGLASDGRCKAFAAGADGVGFGEGAGVLVLERLSDAIRLEHEVLALVRASALSQDGASNGISAPNALSQQRAIRQALREGGLKAAQIDAVEAHGTGTPLGDPIEAEALLATYGQDRSDPVWIGSLKSNLGHTQAAAGVAGVIKMVMAMRHGLLPATLHVDAPSPNIDWSAGSVSVLSEEQPWPAGQEPRRAGVSSFGLSGTNAHLILEEAPLSSQVGEVGDEAPRGSEEGLAGGQARLPFEEAIAPWPLSAKSPDALTAQARQLALRLGEQEPWAMQDVSLSLAARPAFDHRAVVVGASAQDLLDGLDSLARGEPGRNVAGGLAVRNPPVAFVFSGVGSQWEGMARELLERSPVFAARLRECDRALSAHAEWSIERALMGERPQANWMESVQVSLFAVMVSLAELWRACGVRPTAVIGHSQGEVAAACVAGALSLEDAMLVLMVRGRAIAKLEGRGAMGAVALSPAEVQARIGTRGEKLSIAAVNGPTSVVVSGQSAALEELLAECVADGVRARAIPGALAPGHSVHVESLRGELLAGFASVKPRASDVCFCSTAAGEPVETESLDASYWYRNAREPVQFLDGVHALLDRGCTVFVEMSPHPLLTPAIEQAAHDRVVADANGAAARPRGGVRAIGSLRREDGGVERVMRSLGEAWVHGVELDWPALLRGSGAKRMRLPAYAFQRRRYWIDAPPAIDSPLAETASYVPSGWRYKVRWKALAEAPTGAVTGDWLVVRPPDGHGAELARRFEQALEGRGARALALEIDGASATGEQVAAELEAKGPLAGVLSLLALDERCERDAAVPAGLAGTLALVQALVDSTAAGRLWLVTTDAVAVAPSDAQGSALQAMASGLGRSFGCEQPARWGGSIDLPAQPDERAIEMACAVLAQAGEERQLAVRPSGVHARRVTGVTSAGGQVEQGLQLHGSALVTVDARVPAHLVRWLAQAGAEHVLLVGSIDSHEALESLERELAAQGAVLSVRACDLGDSSQLQRAILDLPPERPLTAVFHLAGLGRLHDEREWIGALTRARLEETLRAQVLGALHLDELTSDLDLRAFVVFRSLMDLAISAQLGARAAGGDFLERLVDRRRARGLAATSVAWGLLDEGQVSVELEQRYRDAGIGSMAGGQAFGALAQTLAREEPHAILADVDWERVSHVFAAAGEERLIGDLAVVRRLQEARARDAAGGRRAALAERLAGASALEREALLLDHVRAELAALLGHASAEQVPPDATLIELGLDSISAVDLRGRLSEATGLELAATVVFEQPTAAALARYLLGRLAERAEDGDRARRSPLVERFVQACERQELQSMLASLAEQARGQTADNAGQGTAEAGQSTADPAGQDLPAPVRLCSGERLPRLVCLPSALALSGPHQYVRFARAFAGEREVHALALPGFVEGEWLPASIEALLDAHVEAVARVAGGEPFALAGYSSGGLLAYALAERLESSGVAPAGVVMIDTYPLDQVASEERLGEIARQMLTREGSYVALSDSRLIAMAAYLAMLREWRPAALDAPRLLLQACDPMPGSAQATASTPWSRRDFAVEVPGDHFTMMEHHAGSTAQAVEEWLLGVCDAAGAPA